MKRARLNGPVYEHDPDPAPDEEFLPGELRYLVPGNQGRLLDARRTPVTVASVAAEVGAFHVRIEAFEDKGMRWELPLEEVGGFQFAREAGCVDPGELRDLEAARERFDRELLIDVDEAMKQEAIARVAEEHRALRERLHPIPPPPELDALIARREGDPSLFALTDAILAERGLEQLDSRFAETFVSNPHAGEVVKGHAIMLAELGLCPYRGKVVRDPNLFADPWSKPARTNHLITRLALSAALWSAWGYADLRLYRGAATDRDADSMRPRSSFVSATFSTDVAGEHFQGGPHTRTAVMWRRQVPLGRVLMTFVETRALNGRFKEGEAVLVGQPGNESI